MINLVFIISNVISEHYYSSSSAGRKAEAISVPSNLGSTSQSASPSISATPAQTALQEAKVETTYVKIPDNTQRTNLIYAVIALGVISVIGVAASITVFVIRYKRRGKVYAQQAMDNYESDDNASGAPNTTHVFYQNRNRISDVNRSMRSVTNNEDNSRSIYAVNTVIL